MTTLTSRSPWSVRVATVFLTLSLLTACTLTPGSHSGGTNDVASASPEPTPSADESTKPPVVKVNETLKPEEGQVESVALLGDEAGNVTGAECAEDEGFRSLPLGLNTTTPVDGEIDGSGKPIPTIITTSVKRTKVTITAEGKLLSVRSLVVNGLKAAPVTDDVAQATDTTLRLNTSDWRVSEFMSLTFCLGGSGVDAPVSSD